MGSRTDIAAVVLTAAGLVLAIVLHLLPALFAGLLVHALVHMLAPRMFGPNADPTRARVGVVIVLTLSVLGLTAILVGGATAFYRREGADCVLAAEDGRHHRRARTTMPGGCRTYCHRCGNVERRRGRLVARACGRTQEGGGEVAGSVLRADRHGYRRAAGGA